MNAQSVASSQKPGSGGVGSGNMPSEKSIFGLERQSFFDLMFKTNYQSQVMNLSVEGNQFLYFTFPTSNLPDISFAKNFNEEALQLSVITLVIVLDAQACQPHLMPLIEQ